jgi:hypothetical protein
MASHVSSRSVGRLALLALLLGALGLRAPAGPGRPAAPAPPPAYLFLSPNTDVNLSPEEAQRRLGSPDHVRFKVLAGDILRAVGAGRAEVHDAVGDWSDGTENSFLVVVASPPDGATLRYVAVWFGLLADQKAVLTFRPDGQGPDALGAFDVPEDDLESVRLLLDRHGLPHRTLMERGNGYRVVVLDRGGRLAGPLERLARRKGVHGRVLRGYAEALGGRDRYQAIIRAYEQSPHRARYHPGHWPPLARHAK